MSFALPITGIRSSVVQLEAVADNIKMIVNVSPGKILGELVLNSGLVAIAEQSVKSCNDCMQKSVSCKLLGLPLMVSSAHQKVRFITVD